jgi:exonuclease VII large subunit
MTALPYPAFALPAQIGNGNEFLSLMNEISKTYASAFQVNVQDTWMSSSCIVQDHAARAFAKMVQESTAALTEIVTDAQQRAYGQLVNANQQAASQIAAALMKTMTATFKPGR